MPRPTDAKERTLQTAAFLFQRQGYHATPVSQLLKESGAPRGSLYFHFPGGKEQIATEAVEVASARMEELIARARERSETPEELMGRLTGGLARWLEQSDYTEGCPIATLTLELVPAVEQVVVAVRTAFHTWTEEVGDALVEVGVPPERAESLALLAVAAIEGGLLLSRAERSTVPLRRVREELMRIAAGEAAR